jgi:hypothetical protein
MIPIREAQAIPARMKNDLQENPVPLTFADRQQGFITAPDKMAPPGGA